MVYTWSRFLYRIPLSNGNSNSNRVLFNSFYSVRYLTTIRVVISQEKSRKV